MIDALVAAATTELDENVAAGEIDAERAAEIKGELVEHRPTSSTGDLSPGSATDTAAGGVTHRS